MVLGCGRKRSEGSSGAGGPDYQTNDYGGGGEDETSQLEEVARDILAEARLWEARNSLSGSRPSSSGSWRKDQGQGQGHGGRGDNRDNNR